MKLRGFQLLLFTGMILKVHGISSHGPPTYREYFCKDNKDIWSITYQYFRDGYSVRVNKTLSAMTEIKVQLDSGSTVTFANSEARFLTEKDTINNIFTFVLKKDLDELWFTVQGRAPPNHPPYILSLKIDGVENCKNPDRSFFQRQPIGVVKLFENAPDKFCGRRRINRRFTELVVSGSATQAGDWPWHAAIMKLEKFTLKYMSGNDDGTILLVFKVTVHDGYNHRTLNNDIALLELSTEVVFNNYVQPACLWFDGVYDHLGSYDLKGSVVGWGFDNTDTLSTTLKSAIIPKISDITCIQFDPVFYSNLLNGNKFCAGTRNGTSACNGDSGGGYMVFVADDPEREYYGPTSDYIDGAWYVKGIVSASLARKDASICDPNAYTVFTDVAVYKNWITSNMN